MLLLVVCFVLRISLYKDDGLVDFKIKNYAFFKKHYNSQKCQNNASKKQGRTQRKSKDNIFLLKNGIAKSS